MKRVFKLLLGFISAGLIVACGGGGGDPGSSGSGTGNQQSGLLQLQIVSGTTENSAVTYSITA